MKISAKSAVIHPTQHDCFLAQTSALLLILLVMLALKQELPGQLVGLLSR